ncbi:MAG: tetratricopeptide repeat protein [Flavobacteriales bacterium]
MIKFYTRYFFLIALFFFLGACSTENNTFVNRSYHYTTARFNGHFNAQELIRVSLKTYYGSRKDDFYGILPVNPLPTELEVKGMIPSIDTAVSKCTKVILNHSMPSAENMFYKQAEYNTWMDETWLTVGQALYYRRDYDRALSNFQFIKRFFEKDPSTYVAELWIAKVYIEQRKFADAKLILDGLNEIANEQKKKTIKDYIPFIKKKEKDAAPIMKTSLQFEIHKAYADLSLKRKDYEEAVLGLVAAIDKCKNGKEKARLNYILAQLYQQANQMPDAAKCYAKAMKASAPFDISFNARLNRAVVGGGDRLAKDLKRMLKDAKNAGYKDQIYYAMAMVELNRNQKVKAKSFLTESAFYSTTNKRQKAMSYEKLGDLSFSTKDYVSAQKYYDSCSRFITEDYPNGEIVKNKASKLADLVKAIETANFEDSVQRIAKMSEKDREDFLEETLAQIKKEQQRRKEQEAAKLLALQQNQPTNGTVNNSNKFIFNNPKLREDGYNEFRKMWGQRENEDDWRRSEKIVLNVVSPNANNQDSSATTAQNSGAKDTLSIDQLRKNIPLTDSAYAQSEERLLDARYTAGILYKEVLGEMDLAAGQFQAILDMHQTNMTDLSAAFQLYKLTEGTDQASTYRSYILKNYPNSDAANFFRDPDFYVKQKESALKDQQKYLKLLEKYNQESFNQVLAETQVIVDTDLSNAYRAEYMLLNALAYGQTHENKQELIPRLNRIIEEKPKSDQAARAKEMLAVIKNGYSKSEPANFDKKSIFTYIPNVPQYVIVLLDPDDDIEEARNTVADFSNKGFKLAKVKVSQKMTLAETNFILVQEFQTAKIASEYMNAYKAGFEYLDDLQNNKIYIINQENLKKLIETSKFDEYKVFYDDNY